MTFWPSLHWLPNWSDFSPTPWPWCRSWPLPNYEWFPWSFCNGCSMPSEDAYPSGLLVRSLFGTCLCSYWDQFLRTCRVFLDFSIWISSVLSRFCFFNFVVLVVFVRKSFFYTLRSLGIWRHVFSENLEIH